MIRSQSFVATILAFGALGTLASAQANAGIKNGSLPGLPSHRQAVLSKADVLTQSRIRSTYGELPLTFEANQGQTNSQVKFLARGNGYTLFLTSDEAMIETRETGRTPGNERQKNAAQNSRLPSVRRSPLASRDVSGAANDDLGPTKAFLTIRPVGGNPRARVIGSDELPGKANYFIGNDPKKWCTNVPTYAKVKYAGVYPGVDMVYYGKRGRLEYDFLIAPGADPRLIKLGFAGARDAQIDRVTGEVKLSIGRDFVRLQKPVIYQPSPTTGSESTVEGRYKLARRNQVSFEIGPYDRAKPLVIDPALSYSTYLGGSANDAAYGIAVDASGNAYVTGDTASFNFPVTPGAVQTLCGGGKNDCHLGDAFVTKFNQTGSAVIYSTYLGGSGNDGANAVTLDTSGDAYLSGLTNSTDFPTTAGAFQTSCGGGCSGGTYDAFIAKLNPTGTALVYSTYLGGSSDEEGDGIALDVAGNAYVTGYTQSSDFPTTPGAFQVTCGGGNCANGDGYLTKLNSTGSALVYSTYLGGSNVDYALSVALDASNDAYLTGATASSDFPVTAGAFDVTCNACASGTTDAFVTEMNPEGSALVYSTYLGGNGSSRTGSGDQGFALALDAAGDAYVTGQTYSTDFPTTSGAFQTTYAGSGDAFATELNPAGSALAYSTYLGGTNYDIGTAIALDTGHNVYVTGGTSSLGFPTTPGAFDTTCQACPNHAGDAFVTELNPQLSALIYSTYLGGSGDSQTGLGDRAHAIAVNTSGDVYLAGQARSVDFPASPRAFQTKCGGGCSGNTSDAFVTKFVPGDQVWPLSLSFGNQTVGVASAPQTVTLANSGSTPLSIFRLGVSGRDSGDFVETNTCGSSLAAGVTCTITLTFAPTAVGMRTATLGVTDDAPNSPQVVFLSGTGVSGQ